MAAYACRTITVQEDSVLVDPEWLKEAEAAEALANEMSGGSYKGGIAGLKGKVK